MKKTLVMLSGVAFLLAGLLELLGRHRPLAPQAYRQERLAEAALSKVRMAGRF